MQKLKVKQSILSGKVSLSGAKNSVLRLMAASILTDEEVILKNYPSKLLDAQIHIGMLEALGKKCQLLDDETLSIKKNSDLRTKLVWEDRSIRNTLLILGALLARKQEGAVPLPGGCKLGDRSFDIHEMIMKVMGAEVWESKEMLCAESKLSRLQGTDIHLPLRSTGATENAIIMSVLAQGTTQIWNPHIRPEIFDLINFLNSMGADITVFGQERIQVNGVKELSGIEYIVMPDNMEAITWLIASVMTKGDVEIENFPFKDIEVALIHLRESGAKFFKGDESLIVRGGCCYPIEISTGPHPGINSDVQPLLGAYAACANGESKIVDLRFPGRYGYADEFKKMGIKCSYDKSMLTISGNGGKISGAEVEALDLRAGIALLLCGLVASGETTINNAWQIERGYNNLIEKLQSLGANIEVIE